MRALGTLVAMQLRDKLNLSQWRSWRGNLYSIFATLLKYGIIIAGIWYLFNELSDMRLLSILPGIPQTVLAVIFTAMLAVSTLVATVAVMNSMYFTTDNALLLTLPASRTTVFTSKLIVFYVYELIRNSTYMLPVFIAYGIVNGMSVLFYVWLIPAFLALTALTVAIGALLSIPLMLVANFIKQHRILQSTLAFMAVVAIIYGLVFAINAIPEEIDLVGTWGTTFWEIQAWLTNFSYTFAPFNYLLIGIVGERIGVVTTLFSATQILVLLGMIVATAVVLGITYLIVRPIFFHMASTPFEYKKVLVRKAKKNHFLNRPMSVLQKDLRTMFRHSDRVLSLAYIVVGLPLVILLLNNIYTAIATSRAGNAMVMAFNVGIILILAMSSNIDVAHVYSQDGTSAYINKTAPINSVTMHLVRLLPYAIPVSASLILAVCIFCNSAGHSDVSKVQLSIALVGIYLAHMFICAERDVMNPQHQQYAANGRAESNPNDMFAGIVGYIIALIVALYTNMLYLESSSDVWLKLAIVGVIMAVVMCYMLASKIRLYYKER